MKKIRAFFYILIKSTTSINYYKDIMKTPLAFSMKYFFTLAFITATISTVIFTITTLPAIQDISKKIVNSTIALYPESLIISVKDGKLSTNQPEPYAITMKETLAAFGVEDDKGESAVMTRDMPYPIENIIVFDTNGTIGDLEKYKTMILVNNVNVIIKSSRDMRVYPIEDAPDGQLTKAEFTTLIKSFEGPLKYIPVIVIIVTFIGLFIYNAFLRLLYCTSIALILLISGKILKTNLQTNLPYTKYIQIVIHTITLPILVEILIQVLHINIPGIWFSLVTLIFGIIVLISTKNNTGDQTSA